jgi:Ti-type conjugative transfer relaxase TraA
MMSIRALGNLGDGGSAAKAASHYYSEKSADYYVKDVSPEPDGLWIGRGAADLGLTGSPEREELQLALAGYVAGRQVQNAGRPDRQMGWDVTFSAPKSVSLAWGLADDQTRLAIESAHRAAAQAAHRYLADQITTRRGYAGKKRERARLVSAQFTHHTSRAGDPQLHSHIVIPNFCVRPDGTVGTIESKPFYDHKLTAGALYQADLAYRMRDLGYAIEPGLRGTFRVAGVSPKLEELFSKRDKQIDRLAAEREIRTYAGTRGIVLATRPPKQHTTLVERQGTWREEARAAGLSIIIDRVVKRQDKEAEKKDRFNRGWKAAYDVVKKLTDQNSVFYEKDFIRELARATYGFLHANQVRGIADLARRQGVFVELGPDKQGRMALSTPEMANLEIEMIGAVREFAKKTGFRVDASKVIADMGRLSDEQKATVLSATSDHGIAVIQGRAGSGKTTTLAAIRGAYERAGWKVEGIALSGQAALNMEKEAGIKSRTIVSWKKEQAPSMNTVVIVDEAGMVGSRSTKAILDRARHAGSKVIFVGDERQLQPIEAGGALHAVDRELVRVAPEASSQIQTIRRQKDEWMREAVQSAAQGETPETLRALDEHGNVNIYRSTAASAARRELVNDYLSRERETPEKAVILTHRKGDAGKLNEQVREALQERGLVGENRLEIDNGQRKLGLAIGDRLMFTKNEYRKLDVRNGQRGILKEIDEKARTIAVRMDDGKDKVLNLDEYHSIDYGWASTTHKAQGATVERAYVYGHTKESMANQHATYVQISRAREETKIYAVAGEHSIERPEPEHEMGMERQLPGHGPGQSLQAGRLEESEERRKAMEEMGKTWGRDAMKDTTLDYNRSQQLAQEYQRMREQQIQQQLELKRKRERDNDRGMER